MVADARDDVGDPAGTGLARPVRVREQRAGEEDRVAHPFAQGGLGDVGIAELAHGCHRHRRTVPRQYAGGSEIVLHAAGDPKEGAGRHRSGRMREPPSLVRAKVHVEHVHAGTDKCANIVKRPRDRAFGTEPAQRRLPLDPVAVDRTQGERQVDAVEDRKTVATAPPDLGDQVKAEGLPVRIAPEAAAVEGGIGELLEEVALVAVQMHPVDPRGHRVDRGLPGVLDDAPDLAVEERPARNLRHVEVGVPRGGDRQPPTLRQAFGRADAAEVLG